MRWPMRASMLIDGAPHGHAPEPRARADLDAVEQTGVGMRVETIAHISDLVHRYGLMLID